MTYTSSMGSLSDQAEQVGAEVDRLKQKQERLISDLDTELKKNKEQLEQELEEPLRTLREIAKKKR